MKNGKIKNFILIGKLLILTGFFLSVTSLIYSQTKAAKIAFTGKTEKQIYLLGEPVKFNFEVVNNGNAPTKVPKYGVDVGTLKVFVADEKLEYKEVSGYDWGTKCIFGSVTLEPGQTYRYPDSRILWNGKQDWSHFSESAKAEFAEERLLTDYIFENPGDYFIKGKIHAGGNPDEIESESIAISVIEPKGEDLEVWNRIKGNKEIAFLMQADTLDTNDSNEKVNLVNEVEQIIQKYPNSVYSTYLKPNLEKFKANEARRQEFKERIKANKP